MSTPTLPQITQSRWMDWKPGVRVSAESAESAPSKTTKSVSGVFEGAPPEESPKIEAAVDAAELARASDLLNRNGVRVLRVEGVEVVGVWSDLDGQRVREALRTLGAEGAPVYYLDGDRIPPGFKTRWVDGEPVPLDVLTEMERQPAEPWKVRDRRLEAIGWCSQRMDAPAASRTQHRPAGLGTIPRSRNSRR